MILQMREYLTIKTKGETTKQHASRCSGQNYEGIDTDSSCPLTRDWLGTQACYCDTGERCQRITWGQRDVPDQPGKQRKSLAPISWNKSTNNSNRQTADHCWDKYLTHRRVRECRGKSRRAERGPRTGFDGDCGGWKISPLQHLVSTWWCCLGRVRQRSLRESMSLGLGFEIKSLTPLPVHSLLSTCGWGAYSAQRSQKRASESPELKLQTLVRCYVGAGDWTCILLKRR